MPTGRSDIPFCCRLAPIHNWRPAARRRGVGCSPMSWAALYRALTAAATPLVRRYLERRCRRGKEEPAHIGERFGLASAPRPPGPLVWVHAASVGEAGSVLALIERIVAERPAIAVLMTTGTVAAARLLQDRLPART